MLHSNKSRIAETETQHTSTTKGSEAAAALLPSVSYISLTPRLSQMYTITPLSNLIRPAPSKTLYVHKNKTIVLTEQVI